MKYADSQIRARVRIVTFLSWAVATALWMSFASPIYARANPDDLTLTGSFGFDGYFKEAVPAPLAAEIVNSGGMFDGWALGNLESWVPPTYYTRPIVLPPGGHQKLELACFGCYEGGLCDVPLELYSSDGNMLKEVSLPSYGLGRYDSLVVHLGEPGPPLGNLRIGNNPGCLILSDLGFLLPARMIDYPPRVFPVVLEPEELPSSSLLMEGVNLVAINVAAFLALDQDRKDFLLEYVYLGGNLLVYYRDDVDPPDGWQAETLLPVSSSGVKWTLPLGEFLGVCDEVLPHEVLEMILPRTIGFERGIHGEVIQVAEESAEIGPENTLRLPPEVPSPWEAPDSYAAVAVAPCEGCDAIMAPGSGLPLLVVRNVGSGRAGFAAFDPFIGRPSASDPPIALLATLGLLDPLCPQHRLVPLSLEGFRAIQDPKIRAFLDRGTAIGRGWFIRWLSALGRPLIYLAWLPVLALIAWGRGRVVLVLFGAWAVVMTVFGSFGERNWISDRAVINEMNVYWCEAAFPEDGQREEVCLTRLYSTMIYAADDPTPRTLSFHHAGGLVDEYVDPATWPHGALTIEEGAVTRVPDVVIQAVPYHSASAGIRSFVYRREAGEVEATGQLLIEADRAHFTLDARLPFPTSGGQLVLEAPDPRVSKLLGDLTEEVHLDFDLEDGTEVVRSEGLLPELPGAPTREGRWRPIEPPEEGMSYALRGLANMVMNSPMRRGQAYTQSRLTGKPTRAFVVLGSQEPATELSVDRGELDRRSLTIVVISVPVVYGGSQPHVRLTGD